LDAAGDDRKRSLQTSDLFRSLDVLAGVTLLPEDRLRSIKERLAGLVGCRDFDERDLAGTVICPHCNYRPRPSPGPTALAGLEALGEEARTVRAEWEATIVDALRDPETSEKFVALDPAKRAVLEKVRSDGRLPDPLDPSVAAAVNAALERFER